MKIKPSMTRRQLLESTSSAMLLFPLLRLLRVTDAYGQGGITARAIFVYFPSGAYNESFWPTSQGGTIGTLPVVTAPFEPHKADIILFKGLCTRGDSNHDGGPAQVFAGWGNDGLKPAGVNPIAGLTPKPYSIDQLLADRLGQNTLRRLISLGVHTSLPASRQSVSFRSTGQPEPAKDNPKAAFTDIFGNFTLPTGGSGALRLAQTDVATGKKRIIDYLRGDIRKMKRILGPLEGNMFEAHVLALDDLEKEIAREQAIQTGTMPTGGGAKPQASATCSPKALEAQIPNATNTPVPWYHAPESAPTVFKLNREIMLQAFACGITRVGLLQYGNSDIESDLIAEGVQRPGQRYHLLSHAGGPEFFNTQAGMMREVATLITQLKAAKIGDHSLFDETLILVASDIGDNPNGHDGVNIPALMAGRLGGKLKTGRMIEYPFIPRDWANLNNGMHWNRLLVSVAHLMGQTDIQTIGNTLYSGPLPELLG
ncbi:DUF1552 domain-containing protein [Oligoflexus tunisiensis]|uniref:DUF1552 domain-containing protein n=1 Tax=Oligoflexus tunisiensis TaxID=708132 RepID=UPI00114CFD26|nr:DUF1552 domain-containing protein [Oligoflexus tunisiensis]